MWCFFRVYGYDPVEDAYEHLVEESRWEYLETFQTLFDILDEYDPRMYTVMTPTFQITRGLGEREDWYDAVSDGCRWYLHVDIIQRKDWEDVKYSIDSI